VRRALSQDRFGPYSLQAAIAAVHAQAPSVAATDWTQIVGLYELLLRVVPSPVVELNRAVAVAMRDEPEAGLVLVNGILDRGELAGYHLAHAVRPICAAGWETRLRPGTPTSRRSIWPSRSPSGASSPGGSPN
jgi:RNA polymerase sigma-70 factor (ECF subfamily)